MFRGALPTTAAAPLKWVARTAVASRASLAILLASAALLGPAGSSLGEPLASGQYARDFRMAGDASRTRVVVEFDREPELRWFLLADPARLVLDFGRARLAFAPEDLKARGMIAAVRYGDADGQTARLVLTAKGPFGVDRVDLVKNESGPGFRLVADLGAVSERQFRQALADQAQTTASTRQPSVEAGTAKPARRFRIALDAGHGGFDGGAKGVNGTIEKDVTLSFARELRDRLAASGGFDVFMTRDADAFLPLDERVALARRDEADLMISIHADTIDVPEIHGATVYTLSDKATDALAEATAMRENLSDELAGIRSESDNRQVADILADLIRRETHGFSLRFARGLVAEFSSSIGMIKNPHRAAGFRVLRAPDVPSVLVELGYLSNSKDEAKLLDPAWRAQAIGGIVEAVAAFAGGRQSAGR